MFFRDARFLDLRTLMQILNEEIIIFQSFFKLKGVMVELTGHQRLPLNLKVTTFNHIQLLSISERVPF